MFNNSMKRQLSIPQLRGSIVRGVLFCAPLRAALTSGSRGCESVMDGPQKLFLLAFPAKCAGCGSEHCYLSLSQSIGGAEKYIQARRQVGRITGGIQGN